MKRILAFTFAILLLLTWTGAYAEQTVTNMIPLVRSESADYMFSINDNDELHVMGLKQDYSGDDYANSRHILGRNVADFTLEFAYTPSRVAWNQDRISFRCQSDENEWNQYMIIIKGSGLGEGQRGVSLIKGEAQNSPFAYADMLFQEGQEYYGKLVVSGHDVTLYFSDQENAADPLLSVTLPTEKTSEELAYRDDYLAEGDFQIVSWGGDFVLNYMNLIEGDQEDPEPQEPVWFPHNTVCLAGIELRERFPDLTERWYNVVPVNLTRDAVYTYDLVASNMYYIGKAYVTVENGNVMVDYAYYGRMGHVNNMPESECIAWFGNVDEITTDFLENPQSNCSFGEAVSIADQLNSQDTAILFICNRTTYCPSQYSQNAGLTRYQKDASYANGLMRMLINANGAQADENGQIDLIPRVAAESAAYMFTYTNEGALHVRGANRDFTGDGYANSWHILGRDVADFTLEFDYTASKTAWNQDRICFRCQEEENEWNQYMILIRGSELGDGQSGIALVKGESLDNPFAYQEMTFQEGKQYFCKLIAEGKHLVLYFGDDPSFPDGPLFDVELPDDAATYRNEYLSSGDFQIVSWGGDFVISNFVLTEKAE